MVNLHPIFFDLNNHAVSQVHESFKLNTIITLKISRS